jgi:hypothetical protein
MTRNIDLMSANPKPLPSKTIAAVAGSDAAPVIFAETTYAFGNNGGVVQLEVGVNTIVPIEGSDKVKVRPLCTAHLRFSFAGAIQARDSLTKMIEQIEDQGNAMLDRLADDGKKPGAEPARKQ